MKQKLIHIENLNTAISSIVKNATNIDIPCYLGKEFAYYPETCTQDAFITYPCYQNEDIDDIFIKYLKHTYKHLPKVSIFTFSLFHEIGHYLTLDEFEDSEINRIEKKKEKMNKTLHAKINRMSMKQIEKNAFKYWELPDERKANDTAVEMLRAIEKRIPTIEAMMHNAFDAFYKINRIEE